LPAQNLALTDCIGATLATDLRALHPIPPFNTSMMDGWAVSGPGPWLAVGQVLAGDVGPQLQSGQAVTIATGAAVPDGADAVLRSEHGSERLGQLHADRDLPAGRDFRPMGEECAVGEKLLPAGTIVGPAVLGLAASAGHDELAVRRRPVVASLVLGDELLDSGLPKDGRIRDSLSVQLPHWAVASGCTAAVPVRVADTLADTVAALTSTDADVVLTTGGTARGPVDHLHEALTRVGAELIVDQVAVRPGHPMLLAALAGNRFVVGLPGNPLAAAAAFCTLALPLIAALVGRAATEPTAAVTSESIKAPDQEHRMVPAVLSGTTVTPLPHQGSAMLRGLAAADCFAVAPPGGAATGDQVSVVALPW
jgi:molybdopterin molybdotransferase